MKLIIGATLSAISVFASAANYEVNLTRSGEDLYKISGRDIVLKTSYCYSYAFEEPSILRVSNGYVMAYFSDTATECSVDSAYTSSDLTPALYSLTVTNDGDNWYKDELKNVYIKTSMCLSLAVSEDAVLVLRKGPFSHLFTESGKCNVEKVYSKADL